jgi:hypothetical protein
MHGINLSDLPCLKLQSSFFLQVLSQNGNASDDFEKYLINLFEIGPSKSNNALLIASLQSCGNKFSKL